MPCLQRPYVTPGYSYTGWSPPAQSNEASNGYEEQHCVHTCMHAFDALLLICFNVCACNFHCRYYLERSNSAKLTLKRAKELYPMEVKLHQTVAIVLHDVAVLGTCTELAVKLHLSTSGAP